VGDIGLRTRLDDQTRAWICESTGTSRVTYSRQVFGGWTSTVHILRVSSGEWFVLKRPIWKDAAEWNAEIVNNEAVALRIADKGGLPAPVLIATDADASLSGVAGLLMSRLLGNVHMTRTAGKWIEMLVKALIDVHSVSDPISTGLWKWRQIPPKKDRGPDWSKKKQMWAEAHRLARRKLITEEFIFLHGDYQPGNILWMGSRISGVVDWQFSLIGPRQLDVAHCRVNLALLDGVQAADQFLSLYQSLTGKALRGQRTFDVRDALNFAPEPSRAWDWGRVGRPDLTKPVLRRRLERFIESVVT
jgi:aminoglycoside phosphotransferase (APT) family kinase protein